MNPEKVEKEKMTIRVSFLSRAAYNISKGNFVVQVEGWKLAQSLSKTSELGEIFVMVKEVKEAEGAEE